MSLWSGSRILISFQVSCKKTQISPRNRFDSHHHLNLYLSMAPYDALGAAAAVLFGLFIMSQSCRRPSPLLIHERSQVIVITGGLSGLGRELAQIYMAADARVAILDIKDVIDDEACALSTRYYKCDVSNSNEVEATVNQIESEVSGMKIRM